MNASRLNFAIVSATGSQGAAVASHLLTLPNRYHVRALVRDKAKPMAVELQRKGAEIVEGRLEDVASLRSAFRGADAVFLYTTEQPIDSKYGEFDLGKNALDACIAEKVKWVHLSTNRGAAKRTGGAIKVAAYDEKERLNEYVLKLKIPATLYFLEAAFMTNFLGFHWLQPLESEPGKLALRIPLLKENAKYPMPILSVQHDVPRAIEIVSRQVFGLEGDAESARRDFWFQKEVDLFSEQVTAQKITKTLSDVSGVPIVFEYLSRETIENHIPELVPMLPVFELVDQGYENMKKVSDEHTIVPGDPIFVNAGMEYETLEKYAKREMIEAIKQLATHGKH